MKSQRIRAAMEIVDDAIFLDGDQRREFVARACAEDKQLRNEVESILQHEMGLSIAPADSQEARIDVSNQVSSSERYVLNEEIARGGMGVIVRAHDTHLNREVALKVVLDVHAGRSNILKRFADEARITARLQHPGVVPVHDLGTLDDGRPFLAMKLVRGKTLAQLLTSESDRPDRSGLLSVFEHLCQTMAFAHSNSVIHRDLKPDNVMVGEFGEVQVMDWGLAKVIRSDAEAPADEDQAASACRTASLEIEAQLGSATDVADSARSPQDTRAGVVMGTPAYMSPEQAIGRRDKGTDVFALGAILCEILSGGPPYIGESPVEVYSKSLRGDLDEAFQRLDQLDCDKELIQITKKCLASSPTARFSDAVGLADAFVGYTETTRLRLREAEIATARAQAAATVERKRRRVSVALATSILVIVILGLGSWAWIQRQRAQHSEEIAEVEHAAKTRAEQQLYRNAVLAAYLEFQSGRYIEAWDLLDEAPPHLRNWEWEYLRAQTDQSIVSLGKDVDNVQLAGLVHNTDTLRTVDNDGTVRLWHRSTGQLLETKKTDFGTPVALGPEGNLVLSFVDQRATLWDGRTGRELQQFDALIGSFAEFSAISNGGSHVAIHTATGDLKLFNAQTGELLRSFPANQCQVAFSADTKWLMWCSEDSVHFWDIVEDREPRSSVDLGVISSYHTVRLSRDCHFLAWRDRKRVQLWNLETGDIAELHPVNVDVHEIAFTDDSKSLVTTSVGGGVTLWDTSTSQQIATLRTPAKSAAFGEKSSTEGSSFLVCATGPGWRELRLYDLQTPNSFVLRGHSSFVYPVVVSPDGKWIASGAWDATVRIWDAETGDEIGVLSGHDGPVYSLAFNSQSDRLVSAGADGKLLVWDMYTGSILNQREFHDKVCSVAFTTNDENLVVAHGGLTVLDGASLRLRKELEPQRTPDEGGFTTEIAVRPDGEQFVTYSGKSSWVPGDQARVWDASSLALIEVIKETRPITTAAYSPDGAHLALGHIDGQISVWNLETIRQTLTKYQAHAREIFALRYLPDGSRLMSGGKDGKIRIWDVRSARQVGVLEGHSDYVYSLALSPDGKRLVSGSGDHTIRIWETFPVARRVANIRQARSLYPQADALVRRVFSQVPTTTQAADLIRNDKGLPAAIRHLALGLVLRRCTTPHHSAPSVIADQ